MGEGEVRDLAFDANDALDTVPRLRVQRRRVRRVVVNTGRSRRSEPGSDILAERPHFSGSLRLQSLHPPAEKVPRGISHAERQASLEVPVAGEYRVNPVLD
jgi:hypothetical protein